MSVQAHSSDVEQLHQLGYAQELLRRMSGFSNFAVSFTIISILSGCLTLYYFGMTNGGPAVINIGWPLVGVMVLLVGLAMAEVCSSYPTAGGLYYWAAKLGGRSSAGWSWMTGWFNLLGQVAITAGIDFGLAFFVNFFLSTLFSSWPSPLNAGTAFNSRLSIVAVYAVVLFVHGLLNTFGVRLVALLNDISVWWHIAGVTIIVGVLFLFSKYHQSPTYVFTKFVNLTGFSFPLVSAYVFLTGLLNAQYTFTGYDASAHMTEETRDAAVSGPRGIVWSIIISLIAGWVLLIGVTHAINDADYANIAGAAGAAPGVIFQEAIGKTGASLLLLIVIGAQFYCGMSSVTANSRMIYAFSRDGAVPGSEFWHRINKRTRTPTNSIWFAAVGAFILGLPYLWNPTAYAAVTSIAVIGLYIAYGIPILLRRLAGEKFKRGPWHLGQWSGIVGWIAVVWIAFISILFILPQAAPGNNLATFNYAPVAVAVVLIFAGGYWFLSARNWFKGPKVQGTPEELAGIEAELEAVGSAVPAGATAR
ncbi:MAG TPA: amino acid permease [Candidatus Dormibacteraeota bacterium]|jgi:amino acid permease (GABA permease)|nr:amino acid permease [Candidatus Dormibacteraeota bacterium]